MAVSYTATVALTDYGFDWVDKEIEVEAAIAAVSAADLKTAIREAEASEAGIVFEQIGTTFNPVVLTLTTSTFLSLVLTDPWKLLSLSVSGVLVVGDGNVVSNSDGIDIFAANVNVTYVNNTSAAGVLVTLAEILEVYKDLGLDAANVKTITENVADSDYTETVGAITKNIVKSGATTTVTRT